jgi:hypothetical protein
MRWLWGLHVIARHGSLAQARSSPPQRIIKQIRADHLALRRPGFVPLNSLTSTILRPRYPRLFPIDSISRLLIVSSELDIHNVR